MPKIKAMKCDELESGKFKKISVSDKEILIINLEGQFYAMDDLCSHADASLCDGEIDGCEIVCPLHFARFDIKTGAVTEPPAIEDQKIYAVEVHDGIVYVEI